MQTDWGNLGLEKKQDHGVRPSTSRGRSARRWVSSACVMALGGLGWVGLSASPASGGVPLGDNRYFDWHDSSGTVPSTPPLVLPGAPGSALPADFTPSPFLTDQTAPQVMAYLAAAQAAGVPLAVKVPANLATGGPAQQVFNTFNIKYVFADLEGPNAVSDTARLVNQVRGSAASQGAQVGNYAFATVNNDPSLRPGGIPPYTLDNAYRPTGVNLNTPQLYPGQDEFRQAGRDLAPDGRAIPNLRTGFFMGTVMRLSAVSNNNSGGFNTVPYVSRFENFGNPSLDSDGNPSNGYVFNNPTGDQLLSRQDFEAQMLHYRMRGATGFHLHEPGVIGYTQQQFQADARRGFEAANNAFGFGTPTGAGNAVNSNPNNAVPITTSDLSVRDALTGAFQSVESSGVVYSGVSNGQTTATPTDDKMEILVSNLSGVNKYIVLPTRIAGGNLQTPAVSNPNNGATLPQGTVLIAAGTHRLLQFTKDAGYNWNYAGDDALAFDSDPTATGRGGVGIPEPASLGLLSLASVLVLSRRQRKHA